MIFTNFDELRADFLTGLTAEVVRAGGGFRIYAPNEVLRDPTVLHSATAVKHFAATGWLVSLPTGRVERLTFTELILLAYGLVLVYARMRQAGRLPRPPESIELSSPLDLLHTLTEGQFRQIINALKIENIRTRPARAKGESYDSRRDLSSGLGSRR